MVVLSSSLAEGVVRPKYSNVFVNTLRWGVRKIIHRT